jgi:hypothetical protein
MKQSATAIIGADRAIGIPDGSRFLDKPPPMPLDDESRGAS